MATTTTGKNGTIVVSALRARSNFGKLQRGTPKAVLLSIRDYVKIAAPEPEVLRALGEESSETGRAHWPRARLTRLSKLPGPGSARGNASPPSGNRHECVDYGCHQTGRITAYGAAPCHHKSARLYVSRPILEEYSEVLARPEFQIRKGLRHQLLQLIKNHSYTVVPPRHLEVSDPDDNMFVECADAARADYLLTGNQKHFPRVSKMTKIITTREFISLTAAHLIK
jgi:uncharacterized protein